LAIRWESQRIPFGSEIGDNLVRRRLVRSDLISGGFVGGRLIGSGLIAAQRWSATESILTE